MDALSGDVYTRKALNADVAVNCMLGSTCCCYAGKTSLDLKQRTLSKNGRWQCGVVRRNAERKVLTGSWLGLMCSWKCIWKNPGSLGILVLTSVSCGICGEHFPGDKRSWPVTLNSVGEPQWWFSCKYTVNKAGLWVGVFVFIRENSAGYFL